MSSADYLPAEVVPARELVLVVGTFPSTHHKTYLCIVPAVVAAVVDAAAFPVASSAAVVVVVVVAAVAVHGH